MFANNNIVENNRFYDNAVGIYFMYTEGGGARNNVISHATGATGMALGFKEASDILIENNEIIYCAVGVGSDLSPFQPDTTIRFKGNRFAYNGIAVQLTSELGGNELDDNIFEGNLTDVYPGRPRHQATRTTGPAITSTLIRASTATATASATRRTRTYAYRRPDLDGNSRGPLLQDLTGAGTARFPRAPGAVLVARVAGCAIAKPRFTNRKGMQDERRQFRPRSRHWRREADRRYMKPDRQAGVAASRRCRRSAGSRRVAACCAPSCSPAACSARPFPAICRWPMPRSSGCARPARWTKRISFPAASSAASACRSARCRPSSSPTWSMVSASACPTSTPARRPATSPAMPCSASSPARPVR